MPDTPQDPKWGTCRHCPKQFRAYRKTQLFCSTKCRVAHHRENNPRSNDRDHLAKIAEMVGEADDIGATWESVAAIIAERDESAKALNTLKASLQRAAGHLQEIEKIAKVWGRNADGGHPQGRHFQDPKLLARQFAKIAELVACIRDPNRQDRQALGSEAAAKRARDEADFQELAAIEDPFGDDEDDRYGAGERGVSS